MRKFPLKKYSLLYMWTRAALWNEAPICQPLGHDLCVSLYKLAKFQTVHSVIASAMMKHRSFLEKNDFFRALFVYDKESRINQSINNAVARIAETLNTHSIEYVIVKGQTIACHYPQPEARAAGDIDLYVSQRDIGRIGSVLKQEFDVDLPTFTPGKHQNVECLGATIEVHHRLSDLHCSSHRHYWQSIFEDSFSSQDCVMINGVRVNTLPKELNILYVFQHLYYHLLIMGVGLRQFLDLAVLLKAFQGKYSSEQLRKHLVKLQLYDAFCSIGWIIVDKIGLDSNVFPFSIETKHKRFERRILKIVYRHGNFGQFNHFVTKIRIFHTLNTAYILLKHSILFYRISPSESLMMIPRRIIMNFKFFLNRYKC